MSTPEPSLSLDAARTLLHKVRIWAQESPLIFREADWDLFLEIGQALDASVISAGGASTVRLGLPGGPQDEGFEVPYDTTLQAEPSHGLTDAVADVRLFMEHGQSSQISPLLRPLHVPPAGTDDEMLVRDLVQMCQSYAVSLRKTASVSPDTFSLSMLVEELGEIAKALLEGDLLDFADGLVDLNYISIGAALRVGIPLAEVWAEVHRANLAKHPPCEACFGSGKTAPGQPSVAVDGGPGPICGICQGRGVRVYLDASGKVTKPPGWTPPDIERVLGLLPVLPTLASPQSAPSVLDDRPPE